jgi:hypothetical protein
MDQLVYIRDTGVPITDVLKLLARGTGYDQVLKTYPTVTLSDILASISVAVDLLENWVTPDGHIRINSELKITAFGKRIVDLSKVRETAPRAYEPWDTSEDNRLAALFKEGKDIGEIGKILQRQDGAIRVRLRRLGLIK